MIEDDEFLTSVSAVWPEHTLSETGQVVQHSGYDKFSMSLYTCSSCNALYWPEFEHDEIYTDRFIPGFEVSQFGAWTAESCECWQIPRVIPRVEEPIKGLQRIRDDLERS